MATLLAEPVAGELTATFVRDPAVLCASLRHRGAELLGPLGIPLLHPWANRLSGPHYAAAGRRGRVPVGADFVPRDDHGLPIHGLTARPGAWTWEEPEPGRLLRGRYDFGGSPERLAAFPYPHRLEVDARLGDAGLVVTTDLRATGDVAVPVAFGFHPYLRLPGVPRRAWRVTLPALTHAELDLDQIPTGRATPELPWTGTLGSRTFDDAYLDVERGACFVLEGGGRRITTRFERGFPIAQVFAPSTHDVICFEPMTAPVDALVTGHGLRLLPPGRRLTARFSITVEDA